MLRRILDDVRQGLVRDVRLRLDELRVTLIRGGAPEADQKALARSIAALDEMFLLVVAGEFNAGKSAVVNALLGERVAEEGVTPTTSRVHLLRYGAERTRTLRGGGFEEITLPVPILREMNVVDTPGTNAVIEGHETLTRDFVPRSDLVLFVTSADRPFTASERAFLEAIRSWGKKVLVAVNKTDILDSPEDVQKVVDFVRENTRTLLGLRPEVFAVSARRAQKMKAGAVPDPHASGFVELESHLTRTLDDAARVRLKLENPLGVGLRVVSGGLAAAQSRLSLLEEDASALREIESQLSLLREDLVRGLRLHLADAEKSLLDYHERRGQLLSETLRPTRVLSLLDLGSTRAALDRDTAGFLPAMEKRVDGLADALVAAEARLWPVVMERLGQRQAAEPGRLPPLPPEPPGVDSARLRSALRRELTRALDGDGQRSEGRRLAGGARRAAGGTLALLGAGVALAAASLFVPDSTTLTATLPLVGAGVVAAALSLLPLARRRELARLEERASAQRRRLVPALRASFEAEINHTEQRVREAVAPLDAFVRAEGERVRAHHQELIHLQEGLEGLRARVSSQRPGRA